MPVTVIVNMFTVSHKGSMGISTAFPDVCKTPTPAGPVPIPYPNIAMSKDTSKGSKKVKMDGQSIMLKPSEIMMSAGDEPGSALGVMSNKIKGKAKFVNYSFDVKVEGKNVCRLSDPTQQNCASMNTAAFFHMQQPAAAMSPEADACEKTKEMEKETKSGPSDQVAMSGILEAHISAIKDVLNAQKKYVLYFRKTNILCQKWIAAKHHPKPHSVIAAKTIKTKKQMMWVAWWTFKNSAHTRLHVPPYYPPLMAFMYKGVVMNMNSADYGEPMSGWDRYAGKWITGDYDLMDVTNTGSKCQRPSEGAFGLLQAELNKAMDWDGIQHPPQSMWVSRKDKKDFSDFSVPDELAAWMGTPKGTPVPSKPIAEGRELALVDNDLTVIAPDGCVIYVEKADDYKDVLTCCGCKN